MAEYRINDLAQASGVSVRNIRVYQDRGLLPAPTIRGRTGWYSDEHLVRLNLISRMLERGYTFATISELLHAAHYGMKVEHVLRGTPKAGRFRNFKRAATITITELRKTLNATDRSIAVSQKLGLLAKDGAHFAIRNPEVLEGAEALVKGGIDIDALLDRWLRVQADLEDVAHSFVSIITDRYFDENLPDIGEQEMAKMAELIQTVRPMAHGIVDTTFRRALDEQISNAIGEATKYFDASGNGSSAGAFGVDTFATEAMGPDPSEGSAPSTAAERKSAEGAAVDSAGSAEDVTDDGSVSADDDTADDGPADDDTADEFAKKMGDP